MCVNVLRATAGPPVRKQAASRLVNMEAPVWPETCVPAPMDMWDPDVKSWFVIGTVKMEESAFLLMSANANQAAVCNPVCLNGGTCISPTSVPVPAASMAPSVKLLCAVNLVRMEVSV
ncbi:hypothetical protein F7725_018325 [Dissostichus mawsoni]|uniref:Uncharacterized protein n=1 Tax=Dissostichus mawsoni TaxID=36200 RepID=A0A7J5XU11_DISMA|nr:hypothetical protein F7725_018325 [Dissostichus mawsoni]